jgi:hypothetical protein
MLKNISYPVIAVIEATCPLTNSCITRAYKLALAPLLTLVDAADKERSLIEVIAAKSKQPLIESETSITVATGRS